MPAITTDTDVRLRDRAIVATLPLMPRRLVKRFSAPYVAGDTLPRAITCVREVAALGLGTTVDVLGESITLREEAIATRDAYLDLLDALASLGGAERVNVSVKLTALGLAFDEALALELSRSIAERTKKHGGFMRIDMEDSPYTDATLELHRRLWDEGFDHVGVVVQAYLKRSGADVESLAAKRVPVRLVKGIYIEPAEIAFKEMHEINQNFAELTRALLDAGCKTALATHDDELVAVTKRVIETSGASTDQYEYQMLLGVREDLRDDLARDGHPVRVYVPFGAKWYEYSLRRLRENPRVAGYVASATIDGIRDKLTPGRKARREAQRSKVTK